MIRRLLALMLLGASLSLTACCGGGCDGGCGGGQGTGVTPCPPRIVEGGEGGHGWR